MDGRWKERIPHALHVMKIIVLITIFCKQDGSLLRQPNLHKSRKRAKCKKVANTKPRNSSAFFSDEC
jgi:hypothetical protein